MPLPYTRLTDDFFTKVLHLGFVVLWIFKKVYEGKNWLQPFLGYGLDNWTYNFGRWWLAPLVDAEAHAKGW